MNKKYWDLMKRPPPTALKTILGGKLKGKSDINPQWRYETMTDVFGPIGFGWTYKIIKQWLEQGSDGVVAAFTEIELMVCVDGVWSKPIPGVGGSLFVAQEKSGPHTNDEAYKMSLTDALSVAMKQLGVAADIYAGLWDGSKYVERKQPDTPSVAISATKIAREADIDGSVVNESKVADIVLSIKEAIDEDNSAEIYRLWASLTNNEKTRAWGEFNTKAKDLIRAAKGEAK